MQYKNFIDCDSVCPDVSQAGFELLILFLPNVEIISVCPDSDGLSFYVYGCFACSAHTGQKGTLNPVRLELQVAVRYHVECWK